eukprot:COSAG01_NODE_24813_length_765_cov_3.606607_1_plen_154_part_00
MGCGTVVAAGKHLNAGAPLGHRIVGDFGRCYGRYLTATCLKKGWAIDEHKAAGHRWRAGGQHGGARVKKPAAADDWVHPDAQAGIQLIKAAASRASLSTPSPPPSLTLLEINMRERDDRERVIATAQLEEHRRSVLHFQALARLGAQIQSVIA